MKQIIFLILITILFGCKSDMDKSIKEGHFDACKKHNVETLVNSFLRILNGKVSFHQTMTNTT